MLARLIFAAWVFISLLFLGITGLIFFINYDIFTDWVLHISQQQQFADYFRTHLFPPARYEVLQWVGLGLSVINLLLLVYFRAKISRYCAQISLFLSFIKYHLSASFYFYKQLDKKSLILFAYIFALLIIHNGYNIFYYELQYDEAWTYNHFVSKGLVSCALSPHNNHILYSILAYFSEFILGASKYSLRLPVFLASLSLAWVSGYFVGKNWGKTAAIIFLSVFLFSPSVVFYSFFARGYIFLTLFATIALGSFYLIITKGKTEANLYYFSGFNLANILGFYSVPTYFLPYLGINIIFFLWIIIANKKAYLYRLFLLGYWFRTNLKTLFVVCILYFSQIVSNGLSILWTASSENTGRKRLDYVNKMWDWLFFGKDFNQIYLISILFLIIPLIAIIYNLKNKKDSLIGWFWAILWVNFGLIWIIPSSSPDRSWVFLTIYSSIFFSYIIYTFYKKIIVNYVSYFGLFLLINILIAAQTYNSQTHYHIYWSAQMDKEAKQIADYLIEKKHTEIYCFSRYDKPLLEAYYHQKMGKKLTIYMPFQESKDYKPFADKKYSLVLLDTENYKPTATDYQILTEKGYQLTRKAARFEIYE